MEKRVIKFSSDFIPLIQAGTKTETRRLTKLDLINERPKDWRFSHWSRETDPNDRAIAFFRDNFQMVKTIPCPFGKVGDVLVVADPDGNQTPFLIKIDEIGIERMGEITEAGARSEGFKSILHFTNYFAPAVEIVTNPWLWVLKFHLQKGKE